MSGHAFIEFSIPRKTSASSGKLVSELANVSANSSLMSDKKLTKNEFYCLLLAAQGMTSLETSKILALAKDTVESHRKKVRLKLKSKNMPHAVCQAIRYELHCV